MLDRITNAHRQSPCRPVPKPGGRPPNGTDGKKCKWDQREGCWCWWQSDGSRYKPQTDAERQKLSRQRKKDEQRQAERATNAAAQQARRDAMPKEKVWEEQYAQQRAQQERRAAYDDEQRQMERDASAKAQRDRRGVTSLYNALQLPVGQREDRLLYDLHASGSGFATVNSSRLPTLEEGSALHTECVNTVREEIRLRGKVTIADRARMISTYAERQREAAQLRSCGCCGTRDPSMWYSEPKRLHELPMDHWARIDDAAYTDLLNANVLELMNVKEEKVPVPRVEWHNCFECGGSAYHVIPEAVECDENDMPCIYVCKHCHKHWSRPRGEPVCERMDGRYDHLYWQGAPNASVAAGDDFGRISHLKAKYGIETRRSRLEQLVLASARTQYVSYKVVAFDNQTQRRRLHGHTISFPHAPQNFSSVKLTFRPARALTDERRRKVVSWLASTVGVAVAVVCLGDCSDDAHGLQLPVTIGPMPTGMAETVGAKLRACTADLAEVVKRFGVPLVAVEEPRLESTIWTFCEAVLHAAGATAKPQRDLCVYRRSHVCCFDDARLAVDAVAIQFVGPRMCQTRLDRCAMSLFKEDGDLALRPPVLWNELYMRALIHGEEIIFEGKPIKEQYAALKGLIDSFNARDPKDDQAKMPMAFQHCVQKIHDTAIERCTQASDIANVRSHAQSGVHSAIEDLDEEAASRQTDEAAASRQADQYELDPHMAHVGIFDRHDRKESNTLSGVGDLADAVLSGPADGVGSADTPGVTESGERTREPLVLRRGEMALDDYESAAEVLYRSCWYAPCRASAPRHRLIACGSVCAGTYFHSAVASRWVRASADDNAIACSRTSTTASPTA